MLCFSINIKSNIVSASYVGHSSFVYAHIVGFERNGGEMAPVPLCFGRGGRQWSLIGQSDLLMVVNGGAGKSPVSLSRTHARDELMSGILQRETG